MHVGIENTLIILGHKLRNVTVTRDFTALFFAFIVGKGLRAQFLPINFDEANFFPRSARQKNCEPQS